MGFEVRFAPKCDVAEALERSRKPTVPVFQDACNP